MSKASPKSAFFAAKLARAKSLYETAVALADVEKMRGPARVAFIAFKASAMHETGNAGRIGKAVLAPGKPCTQTLREIAKASGNLEGITRAELEYVLKHINLRREYTGFVMSYDFDNETVTLKRYAAEAKPRKATAKKPKAAAEQPVSGEIEAA
jgi:hypothetical protein